MPYKPEGKKVAVMCHHCKVRRVSHTGGDITCSPNCRKGLANTKVAAEQQLQTQGFTKHPRVLNLWGKGGVYLSTEQVIREGISSALARHQSTIR